MKKLKLDEKKDGGEYDEKDILTAFSIFNEPYFFYNDKK